MSFSRCSRVISALQRIAKPGSGSFSQQYMPMLCCQFSTFLRPTDLPMMPTFRGGFVTASTRSLSAFEGSMFWSSSESSKDKTKEGEAPAAAPSGDSKPLDQEETPAKSEATEDERSATEDKLQTQLEILKAEEAKLKEQVDQLTDRLKRSLAEMENVRTRSTREVDNAKKFGSQGLIKDLLDVPDNLERAAASVPPEALEAGSALEADKLRGMLKGLLEGVRATEKIMLQALRKQGVEQFDPVGNKFNPNEHSALFEVPDGTKEAGVVAVTTKRGYRMHERVIRPAEVGVTRAP